MKKCLSLLLAALMLAAVLTGCGGNPSTEETDAPADTGTKQAAQTNWRRHQCGHRYRRQGGRNQPDLHHRRRPGYLLRLRQRAGAGHHHQRQRNQGHGRGQQRLPGQHRADADERGPTGLRPVRRDELRL